MWVYDQDVGMNCRDVTFVPGLYKIFDEILGEYNAVIYIMCSYWVHYSETVFYSYSKCC